MRGLLVLVIAMGVLIVAGVATIGVTIVHRLAGAAPGPAPFVDAVLDEPADTRITAASASDHSLVITLEGGGPDRVEIYDLGTGRALGRFRMRPRAARPAAPP